MRSALLISCLLHFVIAVIRDITAITTSHATDVSCAALISAVAGGYFTHITLQRVCMDLPSEARGAVEGIARQFIISPPYQLSAGALMRRHPVRLAFTNRDQHPFRLPYSAVSSLRDVEKAPPGKQVSVLRRLLHAGGWFEKVVQMYRRVDGFFMSRKFMVNALVLYQALWLGMAIYSQVIASESTSNYWVFLIMSSARLLRSIALNSLQRTLARGLGTAQNVVFFVMFQLLLYLLSSIEMVLYRRLFPGLPPPPQDLKSAK
jgi:hypothetical protein